ncbi:MAG: UDP-N-acetylmuramate--L-alanine ligase [Proteobacteria bacterium]|nr:UDP-N-acetylmuramate--L-alanine ligase [Pseudomonadota bacterium]
MHVLPKNVGPIHLIGIGGIGMSGVASILHALGFRVQGSDAGAGANVVRLRQQGIEVHIGHDPSHLQDVSVVVISSAVKGDNVELMEARRRRIPVVKRADMLAEIMRLRPSIAVGGTHGKTTTTSLVASLLDAGGCDPTVVSGGIINAYGTNARPGQGAWMVAEADESDGTFVRLPATISVVTNIDPEHLEHYGSFDKLKESFLAFVENIPFYGLGVVCFDHPEVRALYGTLTDRRLIRYGFCQDADLRATNLRFSPSGTTFDVTLSQRIQDFWPNTPYGPEMKDLFLPLLGEHNASNALAAIACALELGLSQDAIRAGLAAFSGVERRFTRVGSVGGVHIIDDYAHHPAEIRAVLRTARQVNPKRVLAVVQPHRYSRLASLFEDFAAAFEGADHVIVAPVYAAGEEPIPDVTHTRLASALESKGHSVHVLGGRDDLAPLLSRIAKEGDYVVCMGAGDITAWAKELPKCLFQSVARECLTIEQDRVCA